VRRTSFLRTLIIGFLVSGSLTSCSAEGSDTQTTTIPLPTSPSTFPPLPTTTVASTPSVLIVGDFLTTDTNGLGLEEAIARVGWTPYVDASEHRLIADGADLIEKNANLGLLPRLIIVSLGANDACLGTPIEGIEPHIRRIAAFAGDQHLVVWVNLQMKDCIARASAINDTLAITAMTTPGFFIADWATDAPIQRLEGDGIHYDRAGSQFRIDYYVSLLRMYANR
jgi:hypothetical protein